MLVITSLQGSYWTGDAWTLDPSQAKDYTQTGGVCREAERIRAERGVLCFVAHIPSPLESSD